MGRMRNNVCQTILITSIFWLLLDVIILFYFLNTSTTTTKKSFYRSKKFARDVIIQRNLTVENSLLEHSDELEILLQQLRFDSEGPGQNGKAVDYNSEDEEMKKLFEFNQFNLMASNLISINRSLPDYRTQRCKDRMKEFEEKVVTPVSIIIVFHNEAFSTLLRTLHSVVNRSPHHLITEIILIDDKSDRDYLKKPLDLYIKRLSIPTKLIHLQERSGLIRARLKGSELAKGKILLFLDAHVEVTDGWLEPLIDRVQTDRKVVVTPIIDVISDETFEYIEASELIWGGFNWHLNFRWYPVSEREKLRRGLDPSAPIKTPTIAGGLFAIDRDYFYEIGSYDEGMQVWGGENLEISFRVWTCGGSLEINMCSRVGHVFRKKTPYTFPGGTAAVILHNARRTAEVWMDEYKQFFYAVVPNALKVETGDLTERQNLRSKLQCKPFKWYLENIYLESPIPSEYYSIGQVINKNSRNCLDTLGKKSGEKAGLMACNDLGGNQAWSLTAVGEIRSDDLCLSSKNVSKSYMEIELNKCSVEERDDTQIFQYAIDTEQIMHNNLCLAENEMELIFVSCDNKSLNTMWYFENFKNFNKEL